MPLAVTHVLLTIIVIDLYRDYVTKHKKFFSLHAVLIGGIAGLIPDIDILLKLVLQNFGIYIEHGGITHTPWFMMLFFIPGLIFINRRDYKKATLMFIISFGVLFHIFLDYFLGGGMFEGIMWFYPISMHTFKIHLFYWIDADNMPILVDAIILIVWLWHEEVKHKISDFI
jgi:membrane-bound metal-dependent hydrolase YbcI (DUF457 family)